jgi:hypothetical protein
MTAARGIRMSENRAFLGDECLLRSDDRAILRRSRVSVAAG